MKYLKSYNLRLFIISFLLILIKYFVSFYFDLSEDLFFKIFRLAESDFETYALIVENLSRFDLKTDWSLILESEKIIGFPFFSLLIHSIFFNFFGYHSYIFLEVFFYFLIILLFFRIFFLIQNNYQIAFITTISLFLSIEILSTLMNLTNSNFFFILWLPIAEFIGQRFPHPLVTSVYFFIFFYTSIKLVKSKINYIKPKYVYIIGISFILLINSFFFHFIKASIFLFILSIYKYKNNFFKIIKLNSSSLFKLFFLIFIGFAILLLQLHFAEEDYSSRLGTYQINLDDKLLILKVLTKKLLQFEILLIISLVFLGRVNYKKMRIIDTDVLNYDIFLIFFIACLISPFLFVIFTNTSIYLYYFWSAVKFSGFLYIFILCMRLFSLPKIFSKISSISFFLIFILLFSNIYNNYQKQIKTDYQLVEDRKEIKIYLFENNYINTKDVLFSNDYPIMHTWLNFKNEKLIYTHGFASSYSDEILENLKFNYFKMLNLDISLFKKMLTEHEEDVEGRNTFASTFGYKYSVNSIRHKKPIKAEYNANLMNRILKISPLVQYNHFFSNSEKSRLIKKYNNFTIDRKLFPNLFIMRKEFFFITNISNLELLGYKQIFDNDNFIILILK